MDRFFVDDDFTSYKAELTRQFEPPCDVEELVRNTETYLQKVETMAQTFENLFGEPVHKVRALVNLTLLGNNVSFC